jgi:hypothetical protein
LFQDVAFRYLNKVGIAQYILHTNTTGNNGANAACYISSDTSVYRPFGSICRDHLSYTTGLPACMSLCCSDSRSLENIYLSTLFLPSALDCRETFVIASKHGGIAEWLLDVINATVNILISVTEILVGVRQCRDEIHIVAMYRQDLQKSANQRYRKSGLLTCLGT